ncbi:MAG: ATP-dependent Clp protease proteolytic subunit [Caulobacteraceae bacterium]
MLHQPLGGVRGQASDISIQAEEIIKMRKRVNQLIASRTGQTLEKIQADTERDFWMSAEQAVAYGIVSKVIERASEV